MRMQSEISHTFWDILIDFPLGFIVMFAFHEIIKTIHSNAPVFFKKDWSQDLDWLIISKQFCHGYVFLF
jgi:hypothetical protein